MKREQMLPPSQNIVSKRNDESLLMTAEINGCYFPLPHLAAVLLAFCLTITRLLLRNIDLSPLKCIFIEQLSDQSRSDFYLHYVDARVGRQKKIT
jgi:hypothetical protein